MNQNQLVALVQIFLCLAFFEQTALSAENGKPAEIAESLKSADASIRRLAAKHLATNFPEKLPKQVLVPLVIQTLQDQDDEVRAMGAAAVNRVAFQNPTYVLKKKGKEAELDLSDETKLRGILLEAISDKNEEVRKGSIATLALVFVPSPEIEKKLSKQYNIETSATVRSAIVQSIGISAYSSEATVEILIAALNDTNGSVKQWAAKTIGELRLPNLLGKLVDAFWECKASPKSTILQAIAKYGTDAKYLVPQLEQALNDAKKMESAIEQTIQTLNAESATKK